MLFTEVKQRLSGERLEFPCRLVEQSPERLVLRYDFPQDAHVSSVELPRGSISYGYYWVDHPYNVYHWMTLGGETLAFYINLSGPVTIGRDYVEWTDLVVDVLIVPDEALGYRVEVLDEDEIPPDIDAATHNHIYDALEEVMGDWPALVRSLSAHSAALLQRGG